MNIPMFLVARPCAAALAAALVLFTANSHGALTHRYSFTNDVSDSVGNANGSLKGDATISDGAAVFPGMTHDNYVELPAGLISNYTSVSFEMWISPYDNSTWLELYAFGNQTADLLGANMLMFTPHSGSTPNDFRMAYAQAAPGYNDERVVTGLGVLDNLGPVNVACVYDPPNNSMSLYTNGALVGTLSPVTTGAKGFSLTNVYNRFSWLGRSLYDGDAPYNGTIDEFRIYNAALTPLQVYVNNMAGPDTVVTNIVINSLTWNAKTNMVVGSRQGTTVTFNTASYGSVTLPNATEPAYVSSDPAIVRVTAQGQLFATGVGTATVSAGYNGTTNSAVIVVSPPVLIHRYAFTADANDSVGTANGTLMNGATIAGGKVVLPGGTTSGDSSAGYVDLPNGLVSNLTAVTFEAWVTDDGSGNWARVWDFGNSVGGEDVSDNGSRYVNVSLPNGSGLVQGTIHVNDRGGDSSVTGARPPVGQEAHIVWSSDIANHSSWLYINGALAAVNDTTIVSPADMGDTVNNWLGRSQFGGDAAFQGSINEFRIYDGAVSPLQVSLDAASGPDKIVTDPGALQDLRLTIGTNTVYNGGLPVALTVYANYANVSNVNVTTLSGMVYQSSAPNLLSVASNGQLLGNGAGSATITANFGGKTGTLVVDVPNFPGYTPATLVHRYSFSEATGSTTVKDSAGTADGTIRGNGAAFDGQGELSLPGGTASGADAATISGYVDLPNHIINVLTNVSFETWITWEGSGSWQRIFDLGTSAGGEDVSDGNGGYLFLAPQGAANFEFSVRDPVAGNEPAPMIASAPLPTGQKLYLAVVYDNVDNVARLYTNAVMVLSGTAPVALSTIDDVNNWLGRSQWNDPMFKGKFDEFRIWDGTLLPGEIAAHFAAGPDSLEAAPKLTATISGQNLVLTWPTAAGFAPESTAQLGTGATWTAVSTTPTTNNGISTVTVPVGTGTQFFRLKK